MKPESIAFGVAGAVFGLIAGWVLGAQQATSRAPQTAPQAASTASAPVLDLAKVKVLEDAAGREPSNAEPRVELGNLYFDAERYEDAVRWYQEGLKLAPNDVNVSTDLGVCYYYMNQPDKALEQFDHSLTIDPKHTKTLLNVGIVKAFGKQDLEGASKAWARVLEIAPDSAEAQAAKRALDSLASAHPGMTETSRNAGP